MLDTYNMVREKVYDLVIIGTGPAGLTASIYASCYHLSHVIIGEKLGGQLQFAPDILNYPGFENISGKELTDRIVSQVKKRGGEIVTQLATNISKFKFSAYGRKIDGFKIKTKEGKVVQGQSIILATGMERRKLNVPGEVEYTGKGVHYCATCEKQDYKGQVCAVVGGANSAVGAAVKLAQAAKKVYIIYRGSTLRGDPIWLDQVEKIKKIEVLYNTIVEEIIGDGHKINSVKLKNNNRTTEQSSSESISLDKLFIEIGGVPGTSLIIPLGVEVDKGGYIKVKKTMETTIKGVFAAGDMVSYGLSIEQISTAVGLGARAAASAFAYIKRDKTPTVWGTSQIKRK